MSDSERYSYDLCPALKPRLLFLCDSFFVGQIQTIGKPFQLLTTVGFATKFFKNCIRITMEQMMGHYGTRPSGFPEKAIQLSWNMYFSVIKYVLCTSVWGFQEEF